MSDEEVLRWYECLRKRRRFTSLLAASDFAWTVERSQIGTFHAVHSYQCRHCNGFHIGRAQLGRRLGRRRRLQHARWYEKTHPNPAPGWAALDLDVQQ